MSPLPIKVVNKALGTDLMPGNVNLSVSAHRHIAIDHPLDYEICLSNMLQCISRPSYIGQGPSNARNFELICRTGRTDRRHILVAIGLDPNHSGNYRIVSSYLITHEKVELRRMNRRIVPALIL